MLARTLAKKAIQREVELEQEENLNRRKQR
jgi:hypothetical protein